MIDHRAFGRRAGKIAWQAVVVAGVDQQRQLVVEQVGKDGGGVLRKARAETTSGDAGQLSDAPAGIEGAHTPAPNGGGDLSALVHQLYGMIKRELKVERERKGGIY